MNESKDRFAIAVRWHGDEQEANEREWLETNGLGGYACGTLSGLRTRRYHGLLIAARNPPTGRTTLLTGVQEKLEVGGQRFCLSRVGRDEGYGFSPMVSVATFQRDPLTRWTFEGPWGQVSRVVLMPYLKNAVVLRYSVFSKEPIVLRVWIFVCERDHHWVTRGNGGFWARERNRTLIEVGAVGSDRPFLYLCHSADSFEWEGKWWEGVALPIERERGLEDWEDLFALGSFVKKVNGEGRLDLIAGIEPEDVWSAPVYELEERKRRNNLVRESSDPLLSALLLAADQFLALRSSQGRWTIVAGYPWFTDWGRDSLISLAGLTLVTGRFRIAREILTHFADRIRDGLVPNFFPEGGGEPAYNTVDASLWFIVALYRYFRYTKDEEFLRSVWAKVKEILESHLDGTWFGIKADGEDGLLSWQAEGEALTWMDAKVWGRPVTPRQGKPVEINALWGNALALIARMSALVKDRKTGAKARKLWEKVRESFPKIFWNRDRKCLYDAIEPDGRPDPSVRCNQLLALALPYRLLPTAKERQVLQVVERDLLTPVGLRTLAPYEDGYRGIYAGPPEVRDAAYHQGTVWTWWWGPYADALFYVGGKRAVQRKVRPALLAFLERHLSEACVGSLSEIFDGDPPHRSRGCFAQAWSVAEVLRVYWEHLLGKRPPALWDEA